MTRLCLFASRAARHAAVGLLLLGLGASGSAAADGGFHTWRASGGELRSLDDEGRLVTRRPLPGSGPAHLALSPAGELWVARGRELRVLDADGVERFGRRFDRPITELRMSPTEGLARVRTAAGTWTFEAATLRPVEGAGTRHGLDGSDFRASTQGEVRLPATRPFTPLEASASPPAAPAPRSGSCEPRFAPDLFPVAGLTSEPGYSTTLSALAFHDAGGGSELYAAGQFHYASGRRVNHVARWDGAGWHPLGDGFDARVEALAVFDDGTGTALYAAGRFAQAGGLQVNGIARWNGRSWTRVGYGFDHFVYALAIFDDGTGPALYAAGSFTTADHGTGWHGEYLGTAAAGLARWDGARWSSLGITLPGLPYALTAFDDGSGEALHIGHSTGISRWDGASLGWTLDTGYLTTARSFGAFDSGSGTELYAAVGFDLLRWTGTSWTVEATLDGYLDALASFGSGSGSELWVGGDFSTAGGISSPHLARWDGAVWSASPAPAPASPVTALAFGSAAAGPALHVAETDAVRLWDGTGWQAAEAPGFDAAVRALTLFDDGGGDDLYAGGSFTTAGGQGASRIARWDGSVWSSLGSGVDGTVESLAVYDDGSGPALYAAGDFTQAGGQSAGRIARWDGSAWSPLGSGLDGTVYALAVYDDGSGAALYAAGAFGTAGGIAASRIARWDGSSWTALGSGLTGTGAAGYALAVYDDGSGPALYAGGEFSSAGGQAASRVARWDGTAWSAVGDGFDAPVRALAVHDDGTGPVLFAGGLFTASGGSPARRVAAWVPGYGWFGVGNFGPASYTGAEAVYTLYSFDDGEGPALYAGGTFLTENGQPMERFARLGSGGWSTTGGGVAGGVNAMAGWTEAGRPVLYIGGSFVNAGGEPSGYVARREIPASCPGEGTAPVITLLSPQDGTVTSASAAIFQGSLNEEAYLTIDGESAAVSPILTFAHGPLSLAEGANVFLLEAEDEDGQASELEVLTVRDTAPPILEWIEPAAGTELYDPRPRLELRASDGGSWVEPLGLALEVGGQPWSAACTLSGSRVLCTPATDLPGGPVSLRVGARDAAGNTGWSPSRAFEVNPASGPLTTTVSGFVQKPDGSPAAGARVSVLGMPGAAGTAASDGSFSLPNVPAADDTPLTLVADLQVPGGSPLFAAASGLAPVPGGTTDAGILTLAPACAPTFADGLFPAVGAGGTVSPRVKALAVFDDGNGPALYAGGDFTRMAGIEAPYLARWDGAAWHAVGGGLDAPVRALAVYDDGSGPALYVGGDFSTAGGAAANRIARWDGSGWTGVGGGVTAASGLGSAVYALEVFDDGGGARLYAGGIFATAGGVTAANLAAWDGAAWTAPGTGLTSTGGLYVPAVVLALEVWDDGTGPALYAGGVFDRAGGQPVRRIARWDGAAWSALGYGVGSGGSDGSSIAVSSLAVYDDGTGPALYAGGLFLHAGASETVHSIARWNGDRWAAVGGGLESGGTELHPHGVQALTVHDDGDGARLYAAGEIRSAGGRPASHLVAWDGEDWLPVGGGVDRGGDGGFALLSWNDGTGSRLYVGGGFDAAGSPAAVSAGGIASWDGKTFSALGTGTSGAIHAAAVYDDGTGAALYVGGSFTVFGGVTARHVARWDGRSASSVGDGLPGAVLALAVHDDGSGEKLYAGGDFRSSAEHSLDGLAVWTGSGWQEVGGGLGGGSTSLPTVSALARWDDGSGAKLYAGGEFTWAGSQSASRVARWDGAAWSALAGGVNGEVRALAPWGQGAGSGLYAGGAFTEAGGAAASRVARWDGNGWTALGSGVNNRVNALLVWDDGSGEALYAGGTFTNAGSAGGDRIARWDGAAWSALGSGLSYSLGGTPEVLTLALYDDGRGTALYAGGLINQAGGVPASGAARWDGASWSALGPGVDGPVHTAAVFDDGHGPSLYLGGDLTTTGGESYLAHWRAPLSCDPSGAWDLAPPVVTFLAPADGAVLAAVRPTLEVQAIDGGSGVSAGSLQLSRNAAAFAASCAWTGDTASCVPDADLPQGPAQLTASAADAAGNVGSAPAISVTVDSLAPSLAFVQPQAGAVISQNPPAVQLTADDAVSGIDESSLTVQLDGSPLSASCGFSPQGSSPTTASCTLASPLPEGPVTLTAVVSDLAGNVSDAATVSFGVSSGPPPDATPPILAFTAPTEGSIFDPAAESFRLILGDVGEGVDRATLALAIDGNPVDASCTVCATTAVCTLSEVVSGDVLEVTATLADLAGNQAVPATVRFGTHPGADLTAPVITLLAPADGTAVAASEATFYGYLSEPASLTLDGSPVDLDAQNRFEHGPVALAAGNNSFTLQAVDGGGNTAALTLTVTREDGHPLPVNPAQVSISAPDAATGLVLVTGAAGAVPDAAQGRTVEIEATLTSAAVRAAVSSDGSFSASLVTTGGDTLGLTVRAANGLRSPRRTAAVPGTPVPPADPATLAPGLDPTVSFDFCSGTAFLYEGPQAIQKGVAAGALSCERSAVVRGRVLDEAGAPLAAASISVLGRPDLGSTLTRTDGRFDLAVAGGGPAVIELRAAGRLPAQRRLTVPLADWAHLPDVVLLPLDTQVTPVDLTSSTPIQVARGSAVTDAFGTRQVTLLVPQGTAAVLRREGAADETLTQLDLRATEYTVGTLGPRAMPGELPAASAYTYAVELSADQVGPDAGSGAELAFSQPLPLYLENFLGLPVSTVVPVGYYDRTVAGWVPAEDGRVVEILSLGGTPQRAELDVDGTGVAADTAALAALGITDAEREALAGLYPAGTTLWRVPIHHFTPYDFNLPGSTDLPEPPPWEKWTKDDTLDCDSLASGSLIECSNQILGETFGLTGSHFGLHYRSDRVPGRQFAYQLEIPLTGPTVPPGLEGVDLEIEVGGQRFTQTFSAQPNQSHTFTWDGEDAYGRRLQGRQPFRAKMSYLYDAAYQDPGDCGGPCFAQTGSDPGTPGLAPTREPLTLSRTHTGTLGIWDARSAYEMGGFSLSPHHSLDIRGKVLQYGSGDRRTLGDLQVVRTFAGSIEGDENGTGEEAKLRRPRRLAAAPFASEGAGTYFYDAGSCKIKHVALDGSVTTVVGAGCGAGIEVAAGNGEWFRYLAPTDIDAAHLTDLETDAAGNLYFLLWVDADPDPLFTDYSHERLLELSPDGVLELLWERPGGCTSSFTLDGEGSLYRCSACGDPSQYIYRESMTAPFGSTQSSGVIVAGGGPPIQSAGERIVPARERYMTGCEALTFGPDGDLHWIEKAWHRVLRLNPVGGWSEVIAGDVHAVEGYTGDGCLAAGDVDNPGCPIEGGRLNSPSALSFGSDGSLYIADTGNHVIRKIDPRGYLSTAVGTGSPGAPGVEEGLPRATPLDTPTDVLALPDGGLLVADQNNHRLRTSESVLDGGAVLQNEQYVVPSEDGREIFRFDRFGRHLSTEDAIRGDVQATFAYDGDGLLTSITDLFGNTFTVDRDAGGELEGVTAPFGHETTFTLQGDGYLATATNPEGESVSLTYSTDGLLATLTDPRQDVTTFTWDAVGRLTRDTDPLGGYTDLARQDLPAAGPMVGGREVTRSTALGRTIVYRSEELVDGTMLRTTTAPDGTVSTVEERPDGSSLRLFADGSEMEVSRTAGVRGGSLLPRLETAVVRTPGGLVSTTTTQETVTLRSPLLPGVSEDHPSQVLSRAESLVVNGRTTTSHYDADSGTLSVTTPMGRTGSAKRNVLGQLVEASQPGIETVYYTYDLQGRPAATTQAGRTVTYTYNPQGFLDTVEDPMGRDVSYTYDLAGRVTSTTLPDGRVVGYAYDDEGNLSSITPPSRPAHGFAHDEADRPEAYSPPDLGAGAWSTQLAYNLDHQLTAVTRPDGQTISYTYHPTQGRLTALTAPHGAYGYTYDPVTGNLTHVTDPAGGSLTFTYDSSLPLSSTWGGAVAGSVEASYNNDFRPVLQTVNGAHSVVYDYDLDGYGTRAGDLTYAYDPVTGLPTTSTLDQITDTSTFSTYGELSTYTARYGSTDLYDVSFTRDLSGRITSKTETLGGTTDTYVYTFDLAGRLTDVEKNGVLIEEYAYDGNSNRLSATYGANVTAGTYDDQDRLLTYGDRAYTYTANGELATLTQNGNTVAYSYDVFGNLTHVTLDTGTQLDYLHDAAQRRIGKKVDGTLVQGFLYAGTAPVAELDGTGTVVSRFVYGRKPHVPEYMVRGGVTYRLVTDVLGSVRLVVDAATGTIAQRLDYDTYGRVILDTNPGFQPFGYAGGLYDPLTKLVRFGARDYDPHTGRWTAKDPIGFAGGDTNLYGYVLNDPVNLIDPTGLAVDVFLDLGFIASDLYTLVANLFRECPTASLGEDATVLGADILGAIVPGVTGLGKAVRYGDEVVDVARGGRAVPRGRRLPFSDADRLTEVNKSLDRIEAGGPFPYKKDGTVFRNSEGRLPSGNYREYTVDTPGAAGRGTRRVVVDQDTGRTYYTDDHYESFVQIDPLPR